MINRSRKDLYVRLFLVMSLSFGLFMTIFYAHRCGLLDAIKFGTCVGLIYGATMALVLGGLHFRDLKRLKTDSSEHLLGVHQVQSIMLQQPFPEAVKSCLRSIEQLSGCRVQHIQQDEDMALINAKTGMTWTSGGEKLLLTVSATDEHTSKVTISSKPKSNDVIVDSGKNIKNIRLIVQALSDNTSTLTTTEARESTP